MTENFFALDWCLCVSVSFIFLLVHKRTARNVGKKKKKKKTKKCTLPYLLTAISVVFTPQKCPIENVENGISAAVDLKISGGSTDLPCLRSNFSSSTYSFKMKRIAMTETDCNCGF